MKTLSQAWHAEMWQLNTMRPLSQHLRAEDTAREELQAMALGQSVHAGVSVVIHAPWWHRGLATVETVMDASMPTHLLVLQFLCNSKNHCKNSILKSYQQDTVSISFLSLYIYILPSSTLVTMFLVSVPMNIHACLESQCWGTETGEPWNLTITPTISFQRSHITFVPLSLVSFIQKSIIEAKPCVACVRTVFLLENN